MRSATSKLAKPSHRSCAHAQFESIRLKYIPAWGFRSGRATNLKVDTQRCEDLDHDVVALGRREMQLLAIRGTLARAERSQSRAGGGRWEMRWGLLTSGRQGSTPRSLAACKFCVMT